MASRDEGSGLDDVPLRDELMTLLIAGHETTASTLTWATFLTTGDDGDRLQQALRAEVAVVAGERPLSVQDIPRLPLCRAVFAEALRLYPPAWIRFS